MGESVSLSKELIAQVRHLELKSKRMATEALSGAYASAFHGRGMEFQEVREYTPGDDVRAIDWNVTARTNTPHIKVYREERELTVVIVVDISPSVFGQGVGRSPIDAARDLAGVIAWLGMRSNDRVGLILFSDKVEYYLPPRKGRGHVWRLLKDIFTHKPGGTSTNVGVPLDFLMSVLKRRSTVFLISDFWMDDYMAPLKKCALRHDLTCVSIRDEMLETLPDAGIVRWQDRETGEQIILDTSDPIVRGAYLASNQKRTTQNRRLFEAIGTDFFEISTEDSVVNPLSHYLLGHKQQAETRGSSR